MTCFWDGILQSLNNDEKNILNLKDNNIYSLIEILKKKIVKQKILNGKKMN